MKLFILLLAGYTLLSQPHFAVAQSNRLTDLRQCCEKILKESPRIYFLSKRDGKMQMQVRGIYIHGSALFLLMQMTNRSEGDYAIDSIRFLVTRNGLMEAGSPRVEPIYIHDGTTTITGYSRVASVFVLPRFALPAGRQLLIDVQRKKGGRHLHIGISNWTLAKARII
jgi:hypothetical protein